MGKRKVGEKNHENVGIFYRIMVQCLRNEFRCFFVLLLYKFHENLLIIWLKREHENSYIFVQNQTESRDFLTLNKWKKSGRRVA